MRTWSDDRVTPGVTWTGEVLLADWGTAHAEAPHGPSHIALMFMQLLEAGAGKAARPHTTTAITATTTRQCFIAHHCNTARGPSVPGSRVSRNALEPRRRVCAGGRRGVFSEAMIHGATATNKTLAAFLLVALAAFCLGDLAQAAFMPAGERADCVVCGEQTPCSSPTVAPLALPVAVLATLDAGLAPAAAMISARSEPPVAPDRQVVPHAPRSPPLA